MRGAAALVCALGATLSSVSNCAQAGEGFLPMLRLSDSDDSETTRFYAQGTHTGPASVAAAVDSVDDAPRLLLKFDVSDPFGCSGQDNGLGAPGEEALVTLRGECKFSTKAETAAASGFSALFVVARVDALYPNASEWLSNPCAINCNIAADSDQSACQDDSACRSGICAQNPRGSDDEPFCCVGNNLQSMFINGTDILSVFVGFDDSVEFLDAAQTGSQYAQVFLKDERILFDGSMVIILLVGTLVTSFASYRAARSERLKAAWVWSPEMEPLQGRQRAGDRHRQAADDTDGAIEQVELGLWAVAGFIFFCSFSLVGLFYLAKSYPQETVIAIQVLFGLSAIFAVSHFFLQPVIRRAWPASAERELALPLGQKARADEAAGWLISFTMVVIWFVFRHADWAWVLLDILGASICCMFLVAVRVPNLKLSCSMLLLFFIYDIFMVFISPIFFGSSVMVDVATAGAGTSQAGEANRVCERVETERMPMLFLVPRFSDPGNYALLGLGDIFIPGLLVTFACRFDYLKAEASGARKSLLSVHKYFVPLCVAYFVALLVTLLANLFQLNFSTEVKGQPALLYLVPATLGTFVFLAWRRGDLHDLWNYSYDELVLKMLPNDDCAPGGASAGNAGESAEGMETGSLIPTASSAVERRSTAKVQSE